MANVLRYFPQWITSKTTFRKNTLSCNSLEHGLNTTIRVQLTVKHVLTSDDRLLFYRNTNFRNSLVVLDPMHAIYVYSVLHLYTTAVLNKNTLFPERVSRLFLALMSSSVYRIYAMYIHVFKYVSRCLWYLGILVCK